MYIYIYLYSIVVLFACESVIEASGTRALTKQEATGWATPQCQNSPNKLCVLTKSKTRP